MSFTDLNYHSITIYFKTTKIYECPISNKITLL